MRFLAFRSGQTEGLAVSEDGRTFRGLSCDDAGFPGWLEAVLAPGGWSNPYSVLSAWKVVERF